MAGRIIIFVVMLLSPGELLLFLFVMVTAIQLFFYLYFFRLLAFYQHKKLQPVESHDVTIVISARDEEDNLKDNLPLILQQEHEGSREVIVVNDHSTDNSAAVLSELQSRFPYLRIIDLSGTEKTIAGKKIPLSTGIKQAENEILLLTDADCSPASTSWALKMQQPFRNEIEIVLGYGPYKKVNGLLNKLIRFETFHTALQYLSFALAGKAYMGVGRNLAYKKRLFENAGGFSSISHVAGGDDDLFINKVATQINTAIVIDPDAFTYSEPKRTWKEWRNQKKRHYSVSKFYRSPHKILLGLYSGSHFLFYALFIFCLVICDPRVVMIVYLIRMFIQAITWSKSMKLLKEEDLFPYFILWDVFLFVYYIVFAPSLVKKPSQSWN